MKDSKKKPSLKRRRNPKESAKSGDVLQTPRIRAKAKSRRQQMNPLGYKLDSSDSEEGVIEEDGDVEMENDDETESAPKRKKAKCAIDDGLSLFTCT